MGHNTVSNIVTKQQKILNMKYYQGMTVTQITKKVNYMEFKKAE